MADQLELSKKLRELGLSETDSSMAMGSIIARAVNPDSERSTYSWLCNRSGLGELIDKDFRFIRYIVRMFKAGVLSKTELKISPEGVPQGFICSPILANIYAHYVIDKWICDMIKPHFKGEVRLFRYADDAIICCSYVEDANRIRKALMERLARFNLHLNEEKTKMVSLFFYEVERIFFKWVNRRSQKKSFNWESFDLFMKKHPPPRPRIIHKLF